MPIFQVCTDKDRKLTVTSEMHNWSSRPPKIVILDILESLGKSLQFSYYHQYMIPCLNNPNNTIIEIYSEDMQKLTQTCKIYNSYTSRSKIMKFQENQDKEIIYNFCIQHIHRKHQFHHKIVTTQRLYMQPFQNITI